MKFVLPFLLSGCLWAINSNGTGGGAFHSTSTWAGGVVPGPADAVTLAGSDTVTVSDSRSVASVAIGNTGRLVVAAGGSLAVTGDISTGSGIGNTTNALTVNGTLDVGGKIAPAGDFGMRSIVVQGTAGNPAILKSTAGTGRITLDGHSVGNPIQADYALFSGLTGIELQYWNNAVSWNVIRSKFNNVGLINVVGQLTPTDVFIHGDRRDRRSGNEHVSSRDVSIFRLFAVNDINAGGGGVRDFYWNVFDKSLFGDANAPYNAGSSTVGGFTFYLNYFGDSQWGYGERWARFGRNFVRIDPAHPQELFHARGDVSDVAILLDGPRGNPHVISPPDFGITVDGIIFGHSDNNANDTDSGEFLLPAAPATPQTYNVRNSIFLPNAEGYSSMELASVAGDWNGGSRNPNYWNFKPSFENNTWYGGFKSSGLAFPALQVSESDNMQASQVQAFRNNILWKPATADGLFLKLLDIGNISTSAFDGLGPIADICPAAVCDYNAGFGHQLTASYANTSKYTNQGRGYAAKFTTTPGAHDVDEDPAFLDWQRSIELWEGDYYRVAKSIAQPAAWSGSATYNVGDFVRHTVTGYYWGKAINYRYINGAGCNGANPQPGAFYNANSWRSCWEFATLYRIREGIKSGEAFTDQVIGVYGDDIVATLNRWIRAGYAPTNPAFENAGHLGYNDIGAVRVAYPAYPGPMSTGPASRKRGGFIRGGSFR